MECADRLLYPNYAWPTTKAPQGFLTNADAMDCEPPKKGVKKNALLWTIVLFHELT
jgi:hypothetical protein